MKTSFNFSEYYNKFNDKRFTTIRGVDSPKNYFDGMVVDINVKRKKIGRAVIDCHEQKRISEIPLEILKTDGEYPGLVIKTKQDFIDLINRFRRFYKITDEHILVTVWFLRWI